MTDYAMLEEEFAGPYKAWKERQDPESTDALLVSLRPVLDSAVRTYGGDRASPTLRSKARRMTIDAVKKYDPGRAKLRTHLMVHLQGLRRAAARESQVIALPERVALELGRIRAADNALNDRLGREPTDLELADETGLSLKRLAYVRQARPGLAEGTATVMQSAEDGMTPSGPAVLNTADDAWLDLVYRDLGPTDQLVMAYTLGLYGRPKLSKQQVAAKLGLSPSAVSQRSARIQSKMDMKDQLGLEFF